MSTKFMFEKRVLEMNGGGWLYNTMNVLNTNKQFKNCKCCILHKY